MQLRINGEVKEFAALATVAELVQALELVGKRVAVELNGEIVPRSQHGLAALADGDELEIVVAVGGG
ncbi:MULTISPECIES: sulfur carrier protein ThiS [Aquitalea]|jgi:sulfur carrier protein|uniref:Sulfur carrier protein ThiS n=1 Tax=Aquitalea magnusonii TaxID=332411 RepID=A0A318JL04_9NEIS|nr:MULTISPECIES: sulfur carrier protein ThiS [Aquitalea]PXX48110.1 sulfur carrier protein ThiS [Aquitalea magnusonii]